jgi:hypothetical protein
MSCLWQRDMADISVLKIMYGTLQALLYITISEFIMWDSNIYNIYIQTPKFNITKFYVAQTSVKLCLFTAFKLNNIDLAWRIPMLYDYMII